MDVKFQYAARNRQVNHSAPLGGSKPNNPQIYTPRGAGASFVLRIGTSMRGRQGAQWRCQQITSLGYRWPSSSCLTSEFAIFFGRAGCKSESQTFLKMLHERLRPVRRQKTPY